MQNDQFTNFADSPSFGLLHEKENGKKIHLIFENLTLFQLIKSQSLSIKLSPEERFIKIGNILCSLSTYECTIKKNRGENQKMPSQIMGENYWTHFIW